MSNEFILYAGVTVADCSLAAGLISVVVVWLRWKNLSIKFDAEFGKKRR